MIYDLGFDLLFTVSPGDMYVKSSLDGIEYRVGGCLGHPAQYTDLRGPWCICT